MTSKLENEKYITITEVDDFFEGNRFVPLRLASLLAEHYKFITMKDTKEIYLYSEEKGIYEIADTFVFAETQRILEEEVNTHRIVEVLNCLKNSTYVNRIDLEPFANLLPVQNGILDLEREELLPFSKDYFFTSKLPIAYDPGAKCPAIENFFASTLNQEDIYVIKELFGYCLLKDYPIQKAFMFVGEGSNGKSVMINLLKHFLGSDDIASLSIQELCESRFAKGVLYQKLANLYADVPTRMLRDVGTFKMLVGGDQHTADVKFRQPFNFTNYAKLIFSANVVPSSLDDTNAFFRRWIIINFPYVFDGENRDSELLKKITTPGELSGLLNVAIRSLNLLLIAGDFSGSKSTEEIREEYIRKSDPVGAFLLDRIDENADGWEAREAVYNAYLDYCKEKKLPICSIDVFAKRFRSKCQITDERRQINKERIRGWRGISLITTPVADDEDATPVAVEDDPKSLARYII